MSESKSEKRAAPPGARVFDVEVDGAEFTFAITQAHFGRYLREAQRDVGMASNNLLLGTVESGQRAALKEAFDADWGLPMQVIAPIVEVLLPERNVTVKKR